MLNNTKMVTAHTCVCILTDIHRDTEDIKIISVAIILARGKSAKVFGSYYILS